MLYKMVLSISLYLCASLSVTYTKTNIKFCSSVYYKQSLPWIIWLCERNYTHSLSPLDAPKFQFYFVMYIKVKTKFPGECWWGGAATSTLPSCSAKTARPVTATLIDE